MRRFVSGAPISRRLRRAHLDHHCDGHRPRSLTISLHRGNIVERLSEANLSPFPAPCHAFFVHIHKRHRTRAQLVCFVAFGTESDPLVLHRRRASIPRLHSVLCGDGSD